VRRLNLECFVFKIIPLVPLIIMSYTDFKELRVSNNVSFFFITIGLIVFLFKSPIDLLNIFFKLLIFCIIIIYAFFRLIGGADFKVYIYLLLVTDVKLFILIFFISLLLGGLVLELKNSRIPLIPIITFVSIALVFVCR